MQSRLHGDKAPYFEKWQYMSYPKEVYDVPYTIDPTAVLGLTGNSDLMYDCTAVTRCQNRGSGSALTSLLAL